MHPGTLRALEFDRVRRGAGQLRADARSARRGSRARPRARAAPTCAVSRLRSPRRPKASTCSATHPAAFPLRAPSDFDETLAAPGRRRAGRSNRSACSALADFLDSIDQSRSLIAELPRRSAIRSSRALAHALRQLRARDRRRSAAPSTPPATSSTTPAPSCARFATSSAAARTRLRGTLESYVRGTRHRALSAGSRRHRSQRPLRARREGRASRTRSRASSTAAPPAARVSISSRSARSN